MMTNDSTPRPTPEADLGNRLAAANWHLVKLVVGALARSAHPQSPQSHNPHIAKCNVQRAAICAARVTVEATERQP